MEVTKSRPVEEPKDENAEGEENKAPKYESYTEMETLNSMVPIWQRPKKDVTEEEYNTFYREKFYDYTKPLRVIHTSAEGSVTGVAFDVDAELVWFRTGAGDWNNSPTADPATGTGGI